MNEYSFISHTLLKWYKNNRRDLPWRNTNDPYKIWISEIILQQTRVVQGLGYYLRFVERFPDVKSLADAEEQEVLKYWQGLGYYSRARNLHKTAKYIAEHYHCVFPRDYDAILGLTGIGEYTAAAITSFSWNMPYPTIDGNVFRFLSRFFLIDIPIDTLKGKRFFTELAENIMDKSKAAEFNQAVMEFGALQCVPQSPDCQRCPFAEKCLAYHQSLVANFPVKANKTKSKELYFYYFHIEENNHTYLRKRTQKGIWKNLFEFPVIESETPLEFDELAQHHSFKNLFPFEGLDFRMKIHNKKHVLSHRILHTTFYRVEIPSMHRSNEDFIRVENSDIASYPVHRLMQYYIENHIRQE